MQGCKGKQAEASKLKQARMQSSKSKQANKHSREARNETFSSNKQDNIRAKREANMFLDYLREPPGWAKFPKQCLHYGVLNFGYIKQLKGISLLAVLADPRLIPRLILVIFLIGGAPPGGSRR